MVGALAYRISRWEQKKIWKRFRLFFKRSEALFLYRLVNAQSPGNLPAYPTGPWSLAGRTVLYRSVQFIESAHGRLDGKVSVAAPTAAVEPYAPIGPQVASRRELQRDTTFARGIPNDCWRGNRI